MRGISTHAEAEFHNLSPSVWSKLSAHPGSLLSPQWSLWSSETRDKTRHELSWSFPKAVGVDSPLPLAPYLNPALPLKILDNRQLTPHVFLLLLLDREFLRALSNSPPQRVGFPPPLSTPPSLLLLKLGGLAGWLFRADAEICPAVSCLKASLFFFGVIRTLDRNRISNYIGRGNIGIHL